MAVNVATNRQYSQSMVQVQRRCVSHNAMQAAPHACEQEAVAGNKLAHSRKLPGHAGQEAHHTAKRAALRIQLQVVQPGSSKIA